MLLKSNNKREDFCGLPLLHIHVCLRMDWSAIPFNKIVRPTYQQRKQRRAKTITKKLDQYNNGVSINKSDPKKHKKNFYERKLSLWDPETSGVGAMLLSYVLDKRVDLRLEEYFIKLEKLTKLMPDKYLMSLSSGISAFVAQVREGCHSGYVACIEITAHFIGLDMFFISRLI